MSGWVSLLEKELWLQLFLVVQGRCSLCCRAAPLNQGKHDQMNLLQSYPYYFSNFSDCEKGKQRKSLLSQGYMTEYILDKMIKKLILNSTNSLFLAVWSKKSMKYSWWLHKFPIVNMAGALHIVLGRYLDPVTSLSTQKQLSIRRRSDYRAEFLTPVAKEIQSYIASLNNYPCEQLK